MSTEAAKELVAKLAVDPDFRSQVEGAATREEKQAVLSSAGYKIVSPDDLVEVQSQLEQKGMFSDITGFMGGALVSVGVNPAGMSASDAQALGKTIGSVGDLVASFI
jgi:hypothetical protein